MVAPESGDRELLEILRDRRELGVGELVGLTGVTATAVRQRLNRLMAQGLVERALVRRGRGRPSHRYSLTERGQRVFGNNYGDLATALWGSVKGLADRGVQRALRQRIARLLGQLYGSRVTAGTLNGRLRQLQELLVERGVRTEVDTAGALPVLRAHDCPYPDLAEADRGICALERHVFQQVLGHGVRLSACRLDGGTCCEFEAKPEPLAT